MKPRSATHIMATSIVIAFVLFAIATIIANGIANAIESVGMNQTGDRADLLETFFVCRALLILMLVLPLILMYAAKDRHFTAWAILLGYVAVFWLRWRMPPFASSIALLALLVFAVYQYRLARMQNRSTP